MLFGQTNRLIGGRLPHASTRGEDETWGGGSNGGGGGGGGGGDGGGGGL
jgi:hypothetical protein